MFEQEKSQDNRRGFLKNSIKTVSLLAILPFAGSMLNSCENYVNKDNPSTGIEQNIDVTQYSYLGKKGYGVLLSIPKVNFGIPVIVVQTQENVYSCFSSMCTHAHCSGKKLSLPLGDYDGYRSIICSCHGSQFDPYNHAKVLKGPAERPLKEFATKFDLDSKILTIYF